MSKGILQAKIVSGDNLPNAIFSQGKPDHITLQFGVYLEDVEKYVGKNFTARASHYFTNRTHQVIPVDLPGWVQNLYSAGKFPHITLSYSLGEFPVDANNILDGPHEKVHFGGTDLHCVIEFVEFSDVYPDW